ncbi:MAG: hypothetical protein MEEGG_01822 [Eggerthella lenta]
MRRVQGMKHHPREERINHDGNQDGTHRHRYHGEDEGFHAADAPAVRPGADGRFGHDGAGQPVRLRAAAGRGGRGARDGGLRRGGSGRRRCRRDGGGPGCGRRRENRAAGEDGVAGRFQLAGHRHVLRRGHAAAESRGHRRRSVRAARLLPVARRRQAGLRRAEVLRRALRRNHRLVDRRAGRALQGDRVEEGQGPGAARPQLRQQRHGRAARRHGVRPGARRRVPLRHHGGIARGR